MKRIIPIAAAMLLAIPAANARTTMTVKGTEYTVDTTFHAKVGPGTTQTSLRLRAGSNPLEVHYLTIDLTTPGVSIRSVCATNKVAGTARTSTMATSNSKDGVLYFAGANGDFFSTSGTSSLGTSVVGTPTTSTTVEREIYKTSNSNYQFTVDTAGVTRICRLNYYTGTATIGDKVTLFKGVNVMSPANGITIYTPRYWGSANQNDYAGNCYQVTAKLVEGDKFYAGGKFRLVVTSDTTSNGDTRVPADGFVIHGRGTSKTGCNTGAKNFVGALRPGDIVEFDNIILTPDGERIYPRTIISGNPKNVGGGETLDTEGERNDASARHPRTSLGVNKDGTKMIMMVIDGRIASSVGVTTSMLADVMRFAGAYEALNVDGGGSSTLYTAALGVRNNCSDGSERAVGNAIFAVLEAPEDNTVAELQFADWAKEVPYLGEYRPTVYAYNKYGKMIDNNFQDYTLVCDPTFGTISDDGHGFVATGNGTGALKAVKGDFSAAIAVTVISGAEIAATLPEVLINNTMEWPIQLHSIVNGDQMNVSPAAYNWTSGDASIASVTPDGTVRGVADGTTTVTGVRGDHTIAVTVNVEVPKDKHHNIEAFVEPAEWAVTSTSLKNPTLMVNAEDHSFNVAFALSSTRGPKVTLSRKIAMWSHPEALVVDVDPGNATIASVTATFKAANDARTVSSTLDNSATTPTTFRFPLADLVDVNDIAVYPIQFNSVAFGLGGKTGTDYRFDIRAINAEYSNWNGVNDVVTDLPAGCPFAVDGMTVNVNATASVITLTDMSGRTIATATDTDTITAPEGTLGPVVVSATIGDTIHSAKIAF